jgi:uncharacterized protein (TIGR02145 family)
MRIQSFTIKTLAILLSTSLFFCCNNQEIPEEEIPEDKVPEIYTGMVSNLTKTTANVDAFICPNSSEVVVFISYCPINQNNWKVDTLDEKLKGTELVGVTFKLADLIFNTKYKYKLTAKNKIGEVESDEADFMTSNYHLPEVKAITAYEIGVNSGISTVKILPSIDDKMTTVKAECTAIPENIWKIVKPEEVFNTSDSIKLSIKLNDLSSDTKYAVRWIVSNKGGRDTCQSDTFETYAVTDYDGNLYHAETYNGSTWLVENFKGTHFFNGDPIPNVADGNVWGKLTSGAFCWYDNKAETGKVYGGLYNWWVANDARELIRDFRTATNHDFDTLCLVQGKGLAMQAGPVMMETGNSHWKMKPNPATNASGFTALPNGLRSGQAINVIPAGEFSEIGTSANFWTSTISTKEGCGLLWKIDDKSLIYPTDYYKNFGLGIRLVKK